MELSPAEEIYPGLYRVEIPLPQNPLKATNSYIFKGRRRNLVVDTGMRRKECLDAMNDALRELGIDLAETDLFITHAHADHLGLIGELATTSSRIYFSEPDASLFGVQDLWHTLSVVAGKHGFPEDELQQAIASHPGSRYIPEEVPPFTIVHEGDAVTAGDYSLKCVETPGHTRGHMCLYEPERKFLIAGDHILGDITPNISSWDDFDDPLREYLSSLDKIYAMDIDLVLPGHRSVIRDFRARIHELKQHHRHRLDEVVSILHANGGPCSAFQVAARMSWDIIADDWRMFPLMQKFFATGEAVAHLSRLAAEGRVRREETGGKILFFPVNDK